MKKIGRFSLGHHDCPVDYCISIECDARYSSKIIKFDELSLEDIKDLMHLLRGVERRMEDDIENIKYNRLKDLKRN